MDLLYTPTFARQLKKMHANEKAALDKAISKISASPTIGVEKLAELSGVYIFKFKVNDLKWLLAYRILDITSILLLLVGPHENFYRQLKKR